MACCKFGQIEDPEERAKQEAAKNFVGTSAAGRVDKDSAADNNEQMSDAEDVSLHCLAICNPVTQYFIKICDKCT